MTFVTNGLFQHIDTFHVPIVGEEKHLIGLCKAPHLAIGTVVWQPDICQAHQAHGEQLRLPHGAERAPQQERLAFNVVVDQKRDHC
jgi:hypothetical protein